MLEITYRLFEMLALVVCLHSLNGEKIKIDVYNVGFVGIEMAFMQMIQEGIVSKGMYFVIYLIYFIYAYLKFGDSVKRTVLKCLLVTLIIGALQILVYIPFSFFYYITPNESLIIMFINGAILLILFFTRNNKIFMSVVEIFAKRDWILKTSLTLCVIVLVYFMYSLKKSEVIEIDIFVLISIFMTMFLIFIYRWQKSTYELNRREQELQITNLYNGVFEEMIKTMRNKQHDFKNQIDAIYSSHLKAESMEELIEIQKKYCDNVLYQNRFSKVLSCTKNSILAGFIYTKFVEAENNGIEIQYEISYRDSNEIVIYDLVDIVGILLDNAIEAVTSTEVSKKIVFELSDAEGINLLVKNPVVNILNSEIQKFFERGYSTKEGERGIGLNKLMELQQKYKYDVYTHIENDNSMEWIVFNIIK
ncbi:MAG: sensor histidine kinase [Eubacterium sp.]